MMYSCRLGKVNCLFYLHIPNKGFIFWNVRFYFMPRMPEYSKPNVETREGLRQA